MDQLQLTSGRCARLFVALAVGLFCTSVPVLADDSLRELVDDIGEVAYFYAWPTAIYESVSYNGARRMNRGYLVTFRLHGRSGISDTPLWVDVVTEIENGQITDFRFGDHNAILVPPGRTMESLGQAIAEMNQQANSSSSFSESASGSVHGIYLTNGCRIPIQIAVRYADASGTWRSMGWWSFPPGKSSYLSDHDSQPLRTRGDVFYYFAESTDGSSWIWEGDKQFAVGERSVRMRRAYDDDGDKNLRLTCE